MAYNRELSQFASLVEVSNTSKRIGFSTDLNVTGIITATRFYGSGRFLTDVIASSIPSTNAGQNQILFNNSGVIEGGSQFYYNSTTNNVGIGTSIPTSKLQVIGNVNISGIATISSGSFTNLVSSNLGSSSLNISGVSTLQNANITNLTISGVSTFTNGPILIGSGTSTGTSLQRLQVTDNAYISGNLGIGITNATSKLSVTGNVFVSGVITSTDYNSTSDVNLKQNIQNIDDPLNKILQIRGVTFEWKEDHRQSAGVIAQEIEKVFPELVNGIDPKTVNYNGLIGVLIEAVKELKNEVDQLKDQINK